MNPTPNPYSSTGRARSPGRRAAGRGWVALAVLGVVAVPASALPAATPARAPVDVPVSGRHFWTDTPVSVRAGETISITASGLIHFGPGLIDQVAPDGLSREECVAIIAGQPSTPGPAPTFPSADLPCWSLIAQIGAAPLFEVGSRKTFRAPNAGTLRLGVNDNRLPDNSGRWKATISRGQPTSSGGNGPAKSTGKGNVLLPALIALAILLALVVAVSRRATRRRRKVGASTDEPVADEPMIRQPTPDQPLNVPGDLLTEAVAPAAVAATAVRAPDAPLEQSVAPLDGEFVDVNIFEVELSNGTDLRVGYNYFPEGTNLHWQVRQDRAFAHGQFATSGGGSLYHFVTLPLGVHLEPDPGSVDVEFTWTIGGVPFRYSVRRDPGY